MPLQWPRAILHVRVDSFEAAVHQRDDPAMRGRPLVVAGSGPRAAVISASQEAQAQGIRAGQPLTTALAASPDITVLRPEAARYREANRQVQSILRRFAPAEKIEVAGAGRTFLDVTTRTRHGTSNPEEVADRIGYLVRTEVQLPVAIGLAVSKLVASVASGLRGTDGLVVVPPDTEVDFLSPLPVEVVPGLSPRVIAGLQQLGVRRLGEVLNLDEARLVAAFGMDGALVRRLAQGRDRSPVDGSKPPRTLSAEITFEADITDAGTIHGALHDLTLRLSERLRQANLRARTVYVKVKLPDARLVSRQVSRTSATDDADAIYRAAHTALEKSHLAGQPVRLLGVGLSSLVHPEPEIQLQLFESG